MQVGAKFWNPTFLGDHSEALGGTPHPRYLRTYGSNLPRSPGRPPVISELAERPAAVGRKRESAWCPESRSGLFCKSSQLISLLWLIFSSLYLRQETYFTVLAILYPPPHLAGLTNLRYSVHIQALRCKETRCGWSRSQKGPARITWRVGGCRLMGQVVSLWRD